MLITPTAALRQVHSEVSAGANRNWKLATGNWQLAAVEMGNPFRSTIQVPLFVCPND